MNWDGSDVEPRLLQPSFANAYFSALPFSMLHTFRRLARTSHVSDVAAPQKSSQMSLVTPAPAYVQRKPGNSGYTYG